MEMSNDVSQTTNFIVFDVRLKSFILGTIDIFSIEKAFNLPPQLVLRNIVVVVFVM